jgi:hypothetical protein
MPDNEGAELLDRVYAFITRFILFPSFAQPVVLALWVIHTHAIGFAHATPYMHVYSPQPRCGKTTLFEVLFMLVARAVSAANITAAALFRLIEGEQPTVLLDEMDNQAKEDAEKAAAIRSIVNAGYRRGPTATVIRCEGRNHDVRRFFVFCAKAFAGIDRSALQAATRDRSVPIRLERKLRSDRVERFRRRRVLAEAEALTATIAAWVETHGDALEAAEPDLPEELDDRAQEVWEPLLAIAEAAGGIWPERARQAALALAAAVDVEEDNPRVELLRDLRAQFEKHSVDAMSSKKLCVALNAIEEAQWGSWGSRRRQPGLTERDVARLLSPFGIRPRTIRLPEATNTPQPTRKGYRFEQLVDAFERYLPPAADQPPHPSHATRRQDPVPAPAPARDGTAPDPPSSNGQV